MREARTRRRVLRAALAPALLAVLASGCAGIPTTGQVQLGRVVRAVGNQSEVAVHQLPPVAQPGLAPVDVVFGFLRALVNGDDRYEIARTYLTNHAAATWRPNAGVITYDDSLVRAGESAGPAGSRTVHLRLQRRGFIDADGGFSPRSGIQRSNFDLQRQQGEWRIDRLPRDVLLSTSDVERAFRLRTLYFLNRTRSVLVPQQVLLKPQPGLATALARAVLNGPAPWLAPAVRTAFPEGTQLLGNVPVDEAGIATVNLGGRVRLASSSQLKQLAAQLVWTLTEVPEVTAVRLLADGSALTIPNAPAVQDRTTWVSFDPAPAGDLPAIYSAHGTWRSLGSGGAAGLASAHGLASVVRAADGSTFAGLRVTARQMSLLTWHSGSAPVTRLTADTLTAPTTDDAGDVFTVATSNGRRWVVEAAANGGVREVAAPTLVTHPVQDLRLSRDGSRVAAVVGLAGRGRLLVGRVGATATGLVFDGFRNVLPTDDGIAGVSWVSASGLACTTAGDAGQRELVEVDVDGYASHQVGIDGLAGPPTSVAAAPGQPLVVTAAGALWSQTASGRWRRVAAGTQPSYVGG